MNDVLSKLGSYKRLERDAGVTELSEILSSNEWITDESVRTLKGDILSLIEDCERWESRQGGLLAASVVLKASDEWSVVFGDEFGERLRIKALELLSDDEFRVRLQAGEVLGLLCISNGCSVYEKSREAILGIIKDNLERNVNDSIKQSDHTSYLAEKLATTESVISEENSGAGYIDASQIFHDTAGWKGLDTGMRCLCCVVDGCGVEFDTFVDSDFLQLIFSTLSHTNRFVRESAFQLLSSLVRANPSDGNARPSIVKHGKELSVALGRGLADNWSQVRLAASVATREFLLGLTERERATFFAELLPKMCLNRYYVAEGVRLYSQESWRLFTQQRGKELVETHICGMVDYYIEQTTSDNHAVREAACACIAELGSKIGASFVQPYVLRLLPALVTCFKDESWPVRDAACIACGNFVKCFADECRPSMPELYRLFFGNLSDGIPSVRQGAAVALVNVIETYGDTELTFVLEKATEGITKIKEQRDLSTKHEGLEARPAVFGVVKATRDNDIELHSNQQVIVCVDVFMWLVGSKAETWRWLYAFGL
ncbi:uncharacterized protein LOC134180707 isoform X2 [Corticium candelabrum]|uniref:uncharacterized protein LOC134180707 isoform X2 n=1 Tax=Corticium candelabrum TaxID=121492 RepID=UPI002E26128C|nr:uncharacterized protein LOC134180707 isoform X2 [Corticium candelabrum]